LTVCDRIGEVTKRIIHRSYEQRALYVERIRNSAYKKMARGHLGCSNLAHSFAACNKLDKAFLRDKEIPNIGIVSAYNDILSAHQPYESYPNIIRSAARSLGAVAQVAGGVPAMCDGVTQGETGMQLSLFSRDVVALSTAVALSHQVFDAVICLGICDKIVPGLVMGTLSFGHLPTIFIPAGPMPTGISHTDKCRMRVDYTVSTIKREELLSVESGVYHAPGTCTFYGTANSNQLLMEVMGLHLPGTTFIPPNNPARKTHVTKAVKRVLEISAQGGEYTPIGEILDERAFVNGIAILTATGGSTNHTIHLIAMAKVAGISLDWEDFSDISEVVPLLASIYPNGSADINRFRDAGGIQFLVKEMLSAGFLHPDVLTVNGVGLKAYATTSDTITNDSCLVNASSISSNEEVLRPVSSPFMRSGGLKVLTGNLGKAITRLSSMNPEQLCCFEAPAITFNSPDHLDKAFTNGKLVGDFIAIVRYQGPKANGMPELHKLTSILQALKRRGQLVALVTDGRMSGASGALLCAMHVTPEAALGGMIARVRNGDLVRIDPLHLKLDVLVDEEELLAREVCDYTYLTENFYSLGVGRELFSTFRHSVGPADKGAISLF